MAKQTYKPPQQGVAGMIFDSLLMLVLVFFALQAPEMMKSWGQEPAPVEQAANEEQAASEQPAAEEQAAAPTATWDQLGQNATMQAAWEKLGKSPADAEAIINNKFDYSINLKKLLSVAALIIFYFFYMLSTSAKQYKDVISEKFD